MSQPQSLTFGDRVRWRISPDPEWRESFVLGHMTYCDDVVLLDDPEHIGMPINVSWCERIEGANLSIAGELRAVYLHNWPNALRPLQEIEP